jgi:hypothetical protein
LCARPHPHVNVSLVVERRIRRDDPAHGQRADRAAVLARSGTAVHGEERLMGASRRQQHGRRHDQDVTRFDPMGQVFKWDNYVDDIFVKYIYE